MTEIGIIIGSTRRGRVGAQVAEWVHGVSAQRSDAEFELVDLAGSDAAFLPRRARRCGVECLFSKRHRPRPAVGTTSATRVSRYG
ncbi:NADPH-dependent FMN reductase [Streptacidiphilus griseoplanus]|uniref:NADPH-dependent FMN reductase n=1 Tax=Peterkaempfera griseoplana TaxID=66896 RepID=UPI0006E3F8C4|nr:NAD(P)H-dependent oxidoreductase [Peterkaempfera griseoplana]